MRIINVYIYIRYIGLYRIYIRNEKHNIIIITKNKMSQENLNNQIFKIKTSKLLPEEALKILNDFIECTKCNYWYHFNCEKLDDADDSDNWLCSRCHYD